MVQRTREELQDLYWRRLLGTRADGRPVFVIAGGSESATEDADSGGDDGGDEAEGDADEGDEEADDTDSEKDKPDDKSGKKKPSAEAERRRREQDERQRKVNQKIANADRRAAESERKFKELKAQLDQDKPESERLRSELADSEGEVTRLRGINRDLALQVAFFRNSRVDWVDPSDAMTIAMRDLSSLEVEDDGTVDDDEVKNVINRIVKDKGHLVRKAQPKSGEKVAGGKAKDGQGDMPDLAKSFPALRTRQR